MMKNEFEGLVGKEVSPEEYAVVEKVYAYHPAITDTKGKDQVATLWKLFGITIFKDMLQTAEIAEELEEEIFARKTELNLALKKMEKFVQEIASIK